MLRTAFTKYLLLTLALCMGICACKKDAETPLNLTGIWQEEPNNLPAFAKSSHRFVFLDGDRFRLQRAQWTDIVDTADACGSSWTDYVMGSYTHQGADIVFAGDYCDSLFTVAQPACHKATRYDFASRYSWDGELLTLNASGPQSNRLRLRKE